MDGKERRDTGAMSSDVYGDSSFREISCQYFTKSEKILQFAKKHGIMIAVHNGRTYSYQYTAYEVRCGGSKIRFPEQSFGNFAHRTAEFKPFHKRTRRRSGDRNIRSLIKRNVADT